MSRALNAILPALLWCAKVLGIIAAVALVPFLSYLLAVTPLAEVVFAPICSISDTLSNSNFCRTWAAHAEPSSNIPVVEFADSKFFEAALQISNLEPMIYPIMDRTQKLGYNVSTQLSNVEVNREHYLESQSLIDNLNRISKINSHLGYTLLPRYVSRSSDVRVQFVAGLDHLAWTTGHYLQSKTGVVGLLEAPLRYMYTHFLALSPYITADEINQQFHEFAKDHAPGMNDLKQQSNDILQALLREGEFVSSYIAQLEKEIIEGPTVCPSPTARYWGRTHTPKPTDKGLELYCAGPREANNHRLEQLRQFKDHISDFQHYIRTYNHAFSTISSYLNSMSEHLEQEVLLGRRESTEWRVVRIWEAIRGFQARVAQISAAEDQARQAIY